MPQFVSGNRTKSRSNTNQSSKQGSFKFIIIHSGSNQSFDLGTSHKNGLLEMVEFAHGFEQLEVQVPESCS